MTDSSMTLNARSIISSTIATHNTIGHSSAATDDHNIPTPFRRDMLYVILMPKNHNVNKV